MPDEDHASFQFLAENSIDVICRAGVDMVFHYVSPSSFRVLGWKPEEMIGKTPAAFMVPESTPSPPDRLCLGNDNSPTTVRMRRKDGLLAWIEIKQRLLRESSPVEPGEIVIVMRDITQSKALEERLAVLARTDTLTGLSTPRAFDEALEREWNRMLREGSRMSLLLLDFDQFSQFHRWQEHVEGDSCLAKAASAVTGALRVTDFAAHYGREGIAIILPATGPGGAKTVAQKVRAAIELLRVPLLANVESKGLVTVSIGISTVLARAGGPTKMPEILLMAAHHALLKAKLHQADHMARRKKTA
jgi:diguanylate cyclase (GGDEF)-like protein/PAS domain S-box-containing protein